MNKSVLKLLLTVLCAVGLTSLGFSQGLTTSALSGVVTDKQGKPISGATITVVHEESGTRATAVTRANGQYDLSGLRVGGPYTITASAAGQPSETQKDVYLAVDQSGEVSFALGNPEVVKLEAFNVNESRDTTFGVGKMSTGSNFTAADIAETPSVRRNIQDIANLDSRFALMSLDQGGQLSAQGQNFRFNSFTVDGVQATDPFGLNSNGFSSLRSPIPYEAIASFSADLAPYDVRRAGATGAFLNAVIKSGSNEFHGSLFTSYTGQNLRAKNPVSNVRDVFKENTYDYSFSGPIIPNKLFFYAIFEEFKRVTAPPAANFVPDPTQLAQIVARAKALGYDTGDLITPYPAKQRTGIVKLDWNISDEHRLSLTYRRNHGEDTSFASFTGTTSTSLSNYWFQQPRNTDSYTAQLFSNWTPNFRTEAVASYTKYDGSPKNHGTPFPDVTVNGVSGTRLDTGAAATGSVEFGTELSRQLNFITTKETVGKLSGEYSFGDHTLVVGGESDQTKYVNKFVQRYDGTYSFANVANWVAGTPPSAFQLAAPYPGFTIDQAFANWSYTGYAGFIEDKWKPSNQLTVTGGLRLDYPYVPDAPPVATGFQSAFGLANNTTNSGNYTIAPRVGFNYQFRTERKTQLRGGVGLFQGKNPAVWISNAYSNAGAVSSITASTAQLAGLTFQPDVTKQPIPTGTLPTPSINVTDKDFVQPAVWKANIALDHKLPFGGLMMTMEFNYLQTYKAINYQFLNYQLATSGPTTMPDGRDRYAGTVTPASNFAVSGVTNISQFPGTTAINATTGVLTFPSTSVNGRRRVATFADVFVMNNTNKGDGTAFTFELKRPMKDNWAYSLSWTHSRATEVAPVTSSVASSNYFARTVFNPNENVASISNTNVPDRVVATLTHRFNWFKNAPTTVTGIWQGRTGHAYSWVFKGDANGDGTTLNDLLYVPTGPNDPNVRFASQAESDAFFALVNSTDLKNYAGHAAPRNGETSPWTQTLDLKFDQEIPMPYSKLKMNLYVDFLNVINFFSKESGLLPEVPFAYKRAVAGATYDQTGNGGKGQWVYTYNSSTFDTVPITANDTPVSRWQIQLGARISF